MSRFVEFRSYNLRPGSGPSFHTLVSEKSLPLVHKWNIDVLAAGPSLHDQDSYFLIQVYDSLGHRQQSQDEFLWQCRLAAGTSRGDHCPHRERHVSGGRALGGIHCRPH